MLVNNLPNSLHGGTTGFNRRVWAATSGTPADGPTPTLRYVSPAGQGGYPGTVLRPGEAFRSTTEYWFGVRS